MKLFVKLLLLVLSVSLSYARTDGNGNRFRNTLDSVGYATNPEKMDSVIHRIYFYHGKLIEKARKDARVTPKTEWKACISPHDDYSYAGYIYPSVLSNVKAKTIFMIGVCHKAKNFGLQDKIIFDGFDFWKAPYGPVYVSPLREEIKKSLNQSFYVTHDSAQIVEHSLEAIIPFLQSNNRETKIIPILVPYMSFSRMKEISVELAGIIYNLAGRNGWKWGKDFAIVISNDAVHYGDEEWGGKNYSYFGCDSAGYKKALDYEHEIIDNCLVNRIDYQKVEKFTQYTVQDTDYKEYKYTWCGRYSVPFGLLLTYELGNLYKIDIKGTYIGHSTSIANPPIPMNDLQMGVSAPANLHHWVGYAAIGYK